MFERVGNSPSRLETVFWRGLRGLGTFVMVLAVLLACGIGRAADGGLELASDVVDAGNVVRGDEAKATFLIKNTGERPFRILGAKPSCGCTVASFDEVIPPGETGKVTAAVKTETFQGPIEKTIAVTTEDPSHASLTLRIRANVVGSVVVLPRTGLAFPSGFAWSYSGRLVIRKDPTERGELNVTNVATSVPWLLAKARRVPSEEPAAEGVPAALPGDFVLEVSVGEDAPRGDAATEVKLRTGLPREPELTIPVSVLLQSPMRADPSPLRIPAPADGRAEATGTVSAVLRPGLAKETVTATASPEPFGVTLSPDGPRKYKATVRWKPATDHAPREGTLVFRVAGESITVPVVVAAPPPAAQANR